MKKVYIALGIFVTLSILFTLGKIYLFQPTEGYKTINLDSSNNSAINSAYVKYELGGLIGYVYLDKINDEDSINTTAGGLGSAIDINVKWRKVKSADICFNYNENAVNEENLAIAYYNEDLGRMELLEDSIVDTENNVVSVHTTHFSKYIVVDSKEWYDAWAKSQLLMRSMINGKRYFDVCFALDSSGSMQDDDKNQLSKDCTYNFIYNLYGGDSFTLYDFDDDVYTDISTITRDNVLSIDSIKSDIMSIDASGGTDIDKALKAINARFSSESTSDLVNIAILLTDGQSSVSDDAINDAKEKDIKVITVGFGNDVNEELLIKIAGNTNGKYYKANTSNIQDIFNDIRQSYIGLDVETDTDGDGIPDVIETTGMRNQYGNLIITDPQKADTDGDGISDGVEMGTVVVNDSVNETDKSNNVSEYIYFDMVSNPNVYDKNTEYEPKVAVEHSSEVAQDKTSINYSFTVKNIAPNNTIDNGNVVNALKNAKAVVTIPDCCTTNDSLDTKIGDLVCESQFNINGTLYHDTTKCSGEKHIISITVTSDNLNPVYDEMRLDNMYWFDDEDLSSDYRISLIQKVRAYTSKSNESTTDNNDKDTDKKELDERFENAELNQDADADKKYYNDIYNNVDIKTIIEANMEASNQQPYEHYKYLCNNNYFLASGFRDYLLGDSAKAAATRVLINLSDVTMGSGMFKTLTKEAEKERYRESLLKYINEDIKISSNEYEGFIIANTVKKTLSAYKNMLSTIQLKDLEEMDNLNKQIDEISSCTDIGELNRKLNNINNEFSRLGFDYVNCDQYKNLEFNFNKTKVNLKSPLSLFNTGLNAVSALTDLIKIEANLELYQNYIDFLYEVENNTCISELKNAAAELRIEFTDMNTAFVTECTNYIKDNAFSSVDNALLKAAFDAESTILKTYQISQYAAKLISNNIMGLKETLDDAVYTICLAECSEIQGKNLEICALKFNNAYIQDVDSAYSAAKDFIVQYNNTVELRKLAEENYYNLVKVDDKNFTYTSAYSQHNSSSKLSDSNFSQASKNALRDSDYSKEVKEAVDCTTKYLDAIRFSY